MVPPPRFNVWTPVLLLPLLTTAAGTPLPLPTTPCTNALLNPSFESATLTPWLDIATGSFSTRGPSPVLSHTGQSSYTAHSNSSNGTTSTLTLSQSYISLPVPVGGTVSCWAWISSSRASGQTRVELFLDAESCGGPVWMGGESGGGVEEWVKVWGEGVVGDVSAGGVGHTVSVSVQGEGVSGEGWSIAVDDVGVGGGC